MYAKTIKSVSFLYAWQEAVNFIVNSKEEFAFGGGKEIKHARDSQCSIILDEYAVQDVLNRVVHPSDLFATPIKLKVYMDEYEDAFDASTFDYTYYNILKEGFYDCVHDWMNYLGLRKTNINQIELVREGLQEQVDEKLASNRNIAGLWNPSVHSRSKVATPCWNELLVRWAGEGKCKVYTHFRSHDLAAWESNMVAMINFINRDIAEPCGCRIVEVFESNFSLHIYDYDLDALKNIKQLQVNPALQKLQDKYDRINSPTIFDEYLK